jgi:Flp pilus assembly protein TadD/2-polyprenyl-3-methyl-5-hydroxy-6-metoxy-1,4-benzoquinol methylase
MSSIDQLFAAAFSHHQRGDLAAADAGYRKVLARVPDHAGALHYLGVAALQRGQMDEAAKLIARAIAQEPRDPQSHYHLGLACGALGRLKEAEAHNRRAIALKPDYAEAWLNLGNALKGLGQGDEALASYRRAIALQPRLAEAHFNLGNVLAAKDDHAGASASYRAAIAARPGYADAYYNLALTLITAQRGGEALAAAVSLLALRLDDGARKLFVEAVASTNDIPDIPRLGDWIETALAEVWCWPSLIAPAAARILRRRPAGAILARPEKGDVSLATADLRTLASEKLFCRVAENVVVPDPHWEAVFRSLRLELAQMAARREADEALLPLACAVARQCFLSDYVFDFSGDEMERAQRLSAALGEALAAGQPVSTHQVAAVASYLPLHKLDHAEKLLDRDWPKPAAALIREQVAEPLEERRLRTTIPAITAIDDPVSRQVQAQYEENPYPRIPNLPRGGAPVPFDQTVQRLLPLAPFTPLGKSGIDILIAGCGTGSQMLPPGVSNARILAIDLSLTSLSHAKRKAAQMGAHAIAFAQGDILRLPATGRSFDVIESTGVLHHLADPFAGWDALVACLRPGGVMRICLYSELARADVAAAQALVKAGGYGPSADDIRRFRRDVAALPADAPARRMLRVADWYNISECRDLLFHVQEHRMTIPQIAGYLGRTGLRFLGFDLPAAVRARYAARFPQDAAMTDLPSWDLFERDNPQTFREMYNFLVQKAA